MSLAQNQGRQVSPYRISGHLTMRLRPRYRSPPRRSRQNAERGGTALPGHVRLFEEDVPEAGSEFLGVSVRSGAWLGADTSTGRADTPEGPGDGHQHGP